MYSRLKRRILSAVTAISCAVAYMGSAPVYNLTAYADTENENSGNYIYIDGMKLPIGGEVIAEPIEISPEEIEYLLEKQSTRNSYDYSLVDTYNYASTYLYENELKTDKEKKLWRDLASACEDILLSTDDYELDNDAACIATYSEIDDNRAIVIARMFRCANPQYYFLSSGWVYGTGVVGLCFLNTFGYDFRKYSVRHDAEIALNSLTTSWMSEFNTISSDLDKELAVCNKIIDYLTYDDPAVDNTNPNKDENADFDQSIISGVLRQTTVCAGYAMMTAYFMNAIGLDCFYVSGPGHAWNLVKIYGNWYEVDNTWADQDSGSTPFVWDIWLNKSHATFVAQTEGTSHNYKSDIWSGVNLPDAVYDEVPEILLKTATATFDGKIRLNIYADVPDCVKSNSYAVFTENGNKTKIYTTNTTYDSTKGYRFSIDLNSVQVDDIVNIRFYDKNDKLFNLKTASGGNYTETGFNYSLIQYFDAILSNSSSDSAKALVQSAKDYCNATKNYFNKTDNEVSAAVDSVSLDNLTAFSAITSGTMPQGASFHSITAMFESDNSLRIYFDYSGKTANDYTYTIDTANATINTKSDGSHYLEVKNISSNRLQNAHIFTISDGTDTYSFELSAITYARSILIYINDTKAQTMAKSLYLYNKAACDYFGNGIN